MYMNTVIRIHLTKCEIYWHEQHYINERYYMCKVRRRNVCSDSHQQALHAAFRKATFIWTSCSSREKPVFLVFVPWWTDSTKGSLTTIRPFNLFRGDAHSFLQHVAGYNASPYV